MDYELASYEPGMRDELVALHARVFGGRRRFSDAYFRWKYEENPSLPAPLFTVALAAGQVVGMRGFYGARWTADSTGESVLIPVGADTAVTPEHRGRRLFEQMMRFALDDLRARGHEYVFNFSANQAVRQLSLRAGWRALVPYGPLQRSGTRLPGDGALATARRRLRGRLGRRLGWTSSEFAAFDRLTPGADGGVVVSSDARSQAMAELVARTRGGQLGQLRDAAFFAWRFRDPRHSYRFLFLERGDRLAGFFVLQQLRGGGWINIVDWAIEDAEARSLLLRAVLAVEQADTRIWSATLPDGFLEELRAAGFASGSEAQLAARSRAAMLVASTDGQPSEHWALDGVPLLDAARWDLRMAYSDEY